MPSPNNTSPARRHLFQLLPLWVFIVLFKIGCVLHYSLIAVFGAQILPLWAVGFATGATTLFQLLFDIPAGRFIDRYGARAALRLSTLFFLIAVGALFSGITPFTYALTLLFSAAGWLFFTPSISAYVLTVTPVAIMGRTTSARRLSEGLGGMLATIGLASILTLSTPVIALLMLYPLIGATIVVWFLWEPAKPQPTHRTLHRVRARAAVSSLVTLKRAFREMSPAAGILAAWSFARGLVYGALWLIVPLGIASGSMNIPGYSLSVFDGAIILVGFTLGGFVDKTRNKSRIILLAILVCGAGLALLSFSSTWLFLVFAIIVSLSDELATVGLWSWLDTLDRHHDEDGIVAGAITLADDLGWTIGPIMAGILLATSNAPTAILASSVPLFALFLIVLLRRRP